MGKIGKARGGGIRHRHFAEDHHDVFFSYATIDNRLHDNSIKIFATI